MGSLMPSLRCLHLIALVTATASLTSTSSMCTLRHQVGLRVEKCHDPHSCFSWRSMILCVCACGCPDAKLVSSSFLAIIYFYLAGGSTKLIVIYLACQRSHSDFDCTALVCLSADVRVSFHRSDRLCVHAMRSHREAGRTDKVVNSSVMPEPQPAAVRAVGQTSLCPSVCLSVERVTVHTEVFA